MRPALAHVLLRSRVARQLLGSFLLSAGIPVAALGILIFVEVSHGLREQSRERLHQAAKSSGLLILEKLVTMRDAVGAIPASAQAGLWSEESRADSRAEHREDRRQGVSAALPAALRESLVAAVLLSMDGRHVTMYGKPFDPIAAGGGAIPATGRIDARDTGDADGRPVLEFAVPLPAPPGSPVRGGGEGAGDGVGVVVVLDAGRLLETAIPAALPPRAEYCVVTGPGCVLGCSRDGLAVHLPRAGASHRGSFEIEAEDLGFFGSYWTLFLDSQLQSESWTVFVLEPGDVALGALARFRSLFPLLALACFGIVFLASVIRIRRQMEPLDRLQEATRELGNGRFDVVVRVTTDDEFGNLADSFNGMTRRLAEQFDLLARLIDLDREILAASDARSIAHALIAELPAVHPCGAVAVLLAEADDSRSLSGWLGRVGDRTLTPIVLALSDDEIAALRGGSGVHTVDTRVAPFRALELLTRIGAVTARVLPLDSAEGLGGLLVLAATPGGPAPWPDPAVVRQVANQAAVAFVNVRTTERNRFLAQRDALTGLANRMLFRDRLEQALVGARRAGSLVGVCLFDLDRFKGVNDTLGHAAGDRLLQQVAARLEAEVRNGNLARMGGDEFTLLLPDLSSPEVCSSIVQRQLRALGEPFEVDGREVFAAASAGIALFPLDGASADDLLKHADAAMYEAKRSGGNRLAFYTQALSVRASRRLRLESALRHAVERDQIVPFYQPLNDPHSREWLGFEVLSRWTDPDLGPVPPGEFIPVAEEIGLIGPLGERILRVACAQARAWQLAHQRALYVSVNLASRQLRDVALPGRVAGILAETGLDPRLLVLELTESEVMEDAETARTQLAALRALGLRISIDDFGTGYSSLGYLQSFPVDSLKIDRRFLEALGRSHVDDAIVRAIVDIGHALELTVVAEGVETEGQLDALRRLGCDVVQGWLFDRALPASDVDKRLAAAPSPLESCESCES
ncbi:MAG: EAL domain-containing protein [Myxococcota bacterium]|nr:EAL domain-containing protein [Myxococcota bacterium]